MHRRNAFGLDTDGKRFARLFFQPVLIYWALKSTEPPPVSQPLRVVPNVDYQRYTGTWFEIARLPNRFERRCARDVTATYVPRNDGRVTVVNRCRRADGSTDEATGVARRVGGRPPSVLQSKRFAPALLSFLPFVWGDYQIHRSSFDYQYAGSSRPVARISGISPGNRC